MGSGAEARAQAARILAEVLAGSATLPEAFGRVRIAPRDVGFVRELCWGTARHGLRLEHVVRAQLKRPPRARDLDVHALLLIGAYQLNWLKVPVHASVHATVAACAHLGKDWARGLVNAVLRRIATMDLTQDDPVWPRAARHDHPEWLLDALAAAWPDQWLAIVEAGNARPPMTLRAAGSRETARARLTAEGIESIPGQLADSALYLDTPRDVTQLPGFAEGRLSVQDEGAQLAAPLLGAETGEHVLDACAAPGGKSLHLAQHTAGVDLVALDIDPRRCARIRENLDRAGASTQVIAADASHPDGWWDGRPFDRILLDAPCTASGILRRQPDVRLLRRRDDVAKLARIQRSLLDALWPLLRAGGTLVYCTCSVLPEEGEQVVQGFLDTHPDAVVSTIEADWGILRGPGRQLLPTVDRHDGFYYARLTHS
jgi:16S rRNA (cytosine967-C5)-methyltransferase